MTVSFFGVFLLSLIESRFNRRKTLIISTFFILVIILLHIILLFHFSYLMVSILSPILVFIPYMILTVYLSKYRDIRCLFSVLTSTCFTMIVGLISGVFIFIFKGSPFDIFLKLICNLFIILFIFRYFRKPYLEILNQLQHGWGMLCLFPFSILAILYLLVCFPANWIITPEVLPASFAMVFLALISYQIIYALFKEIQKQSYNEQQRTMEKIQVEMLKRQIEVIQKNEEMTKIYNHDQKHFYRLISAQLHEGLYKEAIESIDSFSSSIDKFKVVKYCNHITYNAILSSYMLQINHASIDYSINLYIPDGLQVDELDFSLMLSNSIENAIHSCMLIKDQADRKLKLISKVIHKQFLFELRNTYEGDIAFDKNGLPTTNATGHGIGTKSVCAFSDKYNAVLNYRIEDEWLILSILLPISKTADK